MSCHMLMYHRAQDRKTCSNGVKDMKCFAAKHLKFDCRTKRKLFICFLSARSVHISFFSTFRHISHSETAHLRKQIKSTTVAYSKLLNVWQQNKSCLHPV